MIDWNAEISDELLAAYLDSNVTAEETFRVEQAMSSDKLLQDQVDIVEDTLSMQEKFDMWQGDYGFWELGIDPVFSLEDLNVLSNSSNDTDYGIAAWNIDAGSGFEMDATLSDNDWSFGDISSLDNSTDDSFGYDSDMNELGIE